MIEFLTKKVLNYLVFKEVIDYKNEDVIAFYKYGIEITISSLLNIIIIFSISIICNSVLEGIIFLSVFIPTRQFTGGFHADTYLKCNITFGTCYFTILTLSKLAIKYQSYTTSYISIFILVLEMIFIVFYCPIKNRHKEISEKNLIIKYKILGLTFFFIFGITGLYLISINYLLYGCEILITLNSIIVLGIAGIIKERSNKNETKKQQDG